MRKRFARAPRRAEPASGFETAALVRNLSEDERIARLSPAQRWVLTVAAVRFTDAGGRFWPKSETLAAAAGVGLSTVKDALHNAERAVMLRREPWLRPDGTQGSTTFYFDESLLASSDKVGRSPATLSDDTDKHDDKVGRSAATLSSDTDMRTRWPRSEPADKVGRSTAADKVAAKRATNRERPRARSLEHDDARRDDDLDDADSEKEHNSTSAPTERLVRQLLDEIETRRRNWRDGAGSLSHDFVEVYEHALDEATDNSIDADELLMGLLADYWRQFEEEEPSRARLRPLLQYGKHAITGLAEAVNGRPIDNAYAYAQRCAQDHHERATEEQQREGRRE